MTEAWHGPSVALRLGGEALEWPRSLWAAVTLDAGSEPPLAADRRTQVLVIGAGYLGLSTALTVAARRDTVVLDAVEPGWGASGRNNGQVIPA